MAQNRPKKPSSSLSDGLLQSNWSTIWIEKKGPENGHSVAPGGISEIHHITDVPDDNIDDDLKIIDLISQIAFSVIGILISIWGMLYLVLYLLEI